ncbi:uncharacterized protein V1518DRAFT_137075 [Limtongia smithiae]|uniref:uncharacterized protein n=1 Tax=Limtongia smithiae TaxID=1125753 RepID=UPI0034D01577
MPALLPDALRQQAVPDPAAAATAVPAQWSFHVNPLLWSAMTLAAMCALSELLAAYLAEIVNHRCRASDAIGDKSFRRRPFSRRRVARLAAYGLLVAGPVLHSCLSVLDTAYPIGTRFRRTRLFLATLLLTPLLDALHLISLSLALDGARTPRDVYATLCLNAMPVAMATLPWFPSAVVLGASLGLHADVWTGVCAVVAASFCVAGSVLHKTHVS